MPSADWLITPRNIRLFPLAGAITIACLAFMLGVFGLSDSRTLSQLETSPFFRIFSGALGVVSAPAGIYLAIGMFWYWAKLDHSRKLHKIIWFLLFLTTGFFGLAAYSISVYRRHTSPMEATSKPRSLSALRTAALITLPAGAAGSLAFMLRAGHRNPSRVLPVLFAIWVLSPFVALVFALMVSKDWSVLTRATFYTVMLVLAVSSLAIYGDVALGPPRAKTAFAFVVVPPASWLLIAITISTTTLISRRRSRRNNDG